MLATPSVGALGKTHVHRCMQRADCAYIRLQLSSSKPCELKTQPAQPSSLISGHGEVPGSRSQRPLRAVGHLGHASDRHQRARVAGFDPASGSAAIPKALPHPQLPVCTGEEILTGIVLILGL